MMDVPSVSRCLGTEAFGTFCLVFAGTGAVASVWLYRGICSAPCCGSGDVRRDS